MSNTSSKTGCNERAILESGVSYKLLYLMGMLHVTQQGICLYFFTQVGHFQQLLVKEMERQSFLRRESCFKSLRLLVREVTLRCAMVSFNSCQAKNISQAKMTALKLCSIRYVNTRFWRLIIGKSSIVDLWNSFSKLGWLCLFEAGVLKRKRWLHWCIGMGTVGVI